LYVQSARLPRLTRRQSEIAFLAHQGLENQEIAVALRLSVTTVRSYLRDTYCRLGVRNRGALMVWVEKALWQFYLSGDGAKPLILTQAGVPGRQT
jgi:DNA-binding NarL/FixJ family response regulator